MARQERGIYEPSDEVRVFDGAEDDDDDAEGSRLPLLIVLALVVLCAFAGVVWLAYTQGVARGRTETPVLAAAPGPERVAPANAGGAEVPYQGFKIYEQPAPADEGDATTTTDAKPEPVPQQTAKVEPPPAAKPEPAPVVATPKPISPPPATRQAVTPVVPTPVTAKPAPPPPAARTAVATPTPAATGAPRALPGPAATAKPAPLPATVKPPVQAAAATAKPAASGSTVLQIGAFKSQAEADAAWRGYKAKHAALLSGYGPDVQKADLGEKGTWYRLRIAGFADRDVASALCARLGGGCIVGK
jgi:outer membrane biosynthesis protein TonB